MTQHKTTMAGNTRKVLEQEDEAAVITALASYVSECATEAISDHGAFFIGLSGEFLIITSL